MNLIFFWRPVPCLLLALLAATGCGRTPTGLAGGSPGAPAHAAPAEVGVVTITPTNLTLTTELPGRVNAERIAEVRARATGILLQRLFDEGADVTNDQVLFQIDPALFKASYDNAQATLAKAEAALGEAQTTARRNETLAKVKGVSQQAYEDALAAEKEDQAEVLADKASLETAALNLGYARVTAPISGRIGKALITEGALASATDATEMAVIQQLDPIFVDFTQSSADQLKLRRALAATGGAPGGKGARITLVLEDGTVYSATGQLVFSDVTVDEATGSVTVRGEFPNADKLLLPGMFVRGRIETGSQPQAITVPQRGVSRDANGQASVLMVNAQNQVEQRSIQTGAVAGDQWVVTSGLTGGERVIVEGLQKVHVGATVKPVPFAASDAPPAAAAAVTPVNP
jgi:membrane fusion protein (multidrug efflux system)